MKENNNRLNEVFSEQLTGKENTNAQVSLLRLCTLLLAVVSFWATAQGMVEYVFEEEWQAYAASFAVQGLLLGLNFYLPSFFSKSRGFGKKLGLIILTIIIIFTSSWFSYLYIVGKMFGDSWSGKSELLVQEGYREELYNAQKYTRNYLDQLTEEIGKDISTLYENAREIEDENTINQSFQMDWEEERVTYTAEDFTASTEMVSAINVMEQVSADPTNTEIRSQAKNLIVNLKQTLETNLTAAADHKEQAYNDMTAAGVTAQNAIENVRRAQNRGLDTASLEEAANAASQRYADFQELYNDSVKQHSDYDEALKKIALYEVQLNMAENSTYNTISDSLREVQQELFAEEPDVQDMTEDVVSVYESLQEANHLPKSKNDEDPYIVMLNNLHEMLSKLNTYEDIKTANAVLDTYLKALDNIDMNAINNWGDQYREKINELKGTISSLPIILLEEKSAAEWMNYSRAESIEKLDYVLETYVVEHNPAEEGIIYLFSPYWYLALFSLILAFFFDISGFITGHIINNLEQYYSSKGVNQSAEKKQTEKTQNENVSENKKTRSKRVKKGSIHPTINRYVILTGDFMRRGVKDWYTAYDHGEKTEIDCLQNQILKEGIYRYTENGLLQVEAQQLQFAVENGQAQDGIYMNSCLKYKEHMLSVSSDEMEETYLTNVDANVPVYSLKKNEFTIFPVHKLKSQETATFVLALGKSGSQVVAIYMVYKEKLPE